MPATAEKKDAAKLGGATKVATSMAFIVSVAVHLVIFLFVGSVVIFEGAIPPNLFTSMGGEMIADESAEEMDLPPLLEEEFEPEAFEPEMDVLELDTEVDVSDVMSSSDLIVSNNVVPNLAPSISKPVINMGSTDGKKLITAKRSQNTGAKGPGAPRTANIFGRNVSAANFGAVLDISYSTHETIDTAINEIKAGFPDAILVLSPGCGMEKAHAGQVIDGKTFSKNQDEYHYKGKGNPTKRYYSAAFLAQLIKKNSSFEKLWNRAIRDDRAFVVHVDIADKTSVDKQGNSTVAGAGGIQHALSYLTDQGCDVIYWMADFDDAVDEKIALDIARTMARNDVKLIQHDFDGATFRDKRNRTVLKMMVDRTDGVAIVGNN